MEKETCIFCDAQVQAETDEKGNYTFRCPDCGTYQITAILHDRDRDIIRIARSRAKQYAGFIRQENAEGRSPLFSNGAIVNETFLKGK